MKRVLLALALAVGATHLSGCESSSAPTVPAAADNGAPPPKDSGAGADAGGKKGPRIPAKK